MSNTSTIVIITLISFLVIGGGGIALQIFFSKRESKWFGFILPAITFCISLAVVMGVVFFSTVTTGSYTTEILENGETVVVEEIVKEPVRDPEQIIMPAITIFLVDNIPTVVLLVIYAACREKHGRKRALEKMSVQDL
jgi:hypothetical protein